MAKPSVTLRGVKGSSLTWTEADDNFTNLRDATITVASGENSTAIDLNGTITFSAGGQLSVTENAGTITYSGSWLDTVEEDTTPQLGGDLDTNGNDITDSTDSTVKLNGYVLVRDVGEDSTGYILSETSKNLTLLSNGPSFTPGTDGYLQITSGGGAAIDGGASAVTISGIAYPTTDGTDGQVLTTDGLGNLTFEDAAGGIALTDLSVTTNAAGSAALSYDNSTGVFSYTPPDLSSYLTSETNDLTAAVTWANVPDANITQTSVTQHQAALSISESQITFTSSFIELGDLSVGAEGAASGDGAIAYDNSTGVFTYTPPDLSSYLTTVANSEKTDAFVYGKCAEAISKGQVVMFGGVQGDHVLLKKADASASGFKTQWLIGLAETTGATNDFIYVRTLGELVGIDTDTDFAAGDLLYFDPATPGGLTATEPSAPNPKVLMAAVTKENVTDGILLVRPTLSFSMTDLEDVDTASASTNDFLVYNGTKWTHSGLDISKDTTPVLGGALDVNDNDIGNNSTGIVSINGYLAVKDVSGGDNAGYIVAEAAKDLNFLSNGDSFTLGSDSYFRIKANAQGGGIILDPGSGKVSIDGSQWPNSDGSNGQVLYTNGTNTLGWKSITEATGNELENLVEDTTPELGGDLHAGTNTITYNGSSSFGVSFETNGMVNLGYIQSYGETIHVETTTTSGTWAPDAANGPIQYVAMTGNMTINGFSNVSGGQTISILLDNTGGTYTLTLGANILQAGGDAETLSGGFDLLTITCVDDATPVYLAAIQSYS